MPFSHASNRDLLFRPLLVFQSTWPSGGWSWDNRFSCAASTISQDLSEEGWKAAKALLRNVWDEQNIGTAPAIIAKVASDTGGVRRGQFLLSTDAVDGMLLYGLWWPWGEEGSNISMRVGLTGSGSRSEVAEFRNLLKVRDE